MNGEEMYTLDNFYQSDQWVKLYTRLRLDRINDEGELICEYCGRPITRKYDAIAHHTVFLTEENVNDYSVSLNPDLIKIVHHACHNRIHNKLGYIKKEVFLVWGSPLAGKSTYVKSVASTGDLIIDMDSIWQCISGQDRYIKPQRLNAVAFGVRDYLLDCVRVRRGKWDCAYIIGGYPLISERTRLEKRYGCRSVYIESTRGECVERLNGQNDRDKAEWLKYIDEWWRRYTPPTPIA